MEKQIQNSDDDDKVWVTISRTINLGNYENIKIEAGLSQTLKPDDNQLALMEALCDMTFHVIKQKGKEYKTILKPKKD